jgi:hypothetical protein
MTLWQHHDCRLLRRENIKVCAVPDVAAASTQNSAKAMQRGARQCTNEVLMIAPTAFGFNDQTAQDNSFMHASREGGSTDAGSDVTQHVLREFSGLYRELTEVILCNLSSPIVAMLLHGTDTNLAPSFAGCCIQCHLIAADRLAWLLIVMH